MNWCIPGFRGVCYFYGNHTNGIYIDIGSLFAIVVVGVLVYALVWACKKGN